MEKCLFVCKINTKLIGVLSSLSIKNKKILNEEILAYSMPYYLESIYLSQKLETIDNIRAYVWSNVGKYFEEEGYNISFDVDEKEETCTIILKWKNFINKWSPRAQGGDEQCEEQQRPLHVSTTFIDLRESLLGSS